MVFDFFGFGLIFTPHPPCGYSTLLCLFVRLIPGVLCPFDFKKKVAWYMYIDLGGLVAFHSFLVPSILSDDILAVWVSCVFSIMQLAGVEG